MVAHTIPFYSENPIKIIITRTETAATNALDMLVKLSSKSSSCEMPAVMRISSHNGQFRFSTIL